MSARRDFLHGIRHPFPPESRILHPAVGEVVNPVGGHVIYHDPANVEPVEGPEYFFNIPNKHACLQAIG